VEQSQKLDDLERLVGKLAKSKERTTRQLQGMKRDLHHTETEAKEEKAKRSSSMSQLMVELNSLKETLQETRSREKQVRNSHRLSTTSPNQHG
jgi:septal ring factor EnvC (AmiA/AmiB activator)